MGPKKKKKKAWKKEGELEACLSTRNISLCARGNSENHKGEEGIKALDACTAHLGLKRRPSWNLI